MISYLPMAMKCENCGKGVMYGHAVSHAKNRTKRLFLPNLHFTRVAVGGRVQRLRFCTKCIRMFKKKTKEKAVQSQASISPSAIA